MQSKQEVYGRTCWRYGQPCIEIAGTGGSQWANVTEVIKFDGLPAARKAFASIADEINWQNAMPMDSD